MVISQEVKGAIRNDMVKCAKEAGLKSFEQVCVLEDVMSHSVIWHLCLIPRPR